ncbi:hypothetical protein [Saccharothrix sp. HUAS TT1]|uniref:hypothetical protein n=1 Tax=unclassified Saccharothrix TaxID=2593673 RepID=UPI00345BEB5F
MLKLPRRALVPLAAATTLGALVLVAPPALAADIDVPCDPNALVGAVVAANASGLPDTLSLAPDCVYTLTAPASANGEDGLPAIVGKLTVHGNGATLARAAGAPRFRFISNWGDLAIDHLTFTGGHAPDGVGVNSYGEGNPGKSGGAIQNWGPLAIADSAFTGNRAGAGAPGPNATTTTRAGRGGLGGSGGAISSYSSGSIPLTITGTSIADNTSGTGGRGGGGVAGTPGARGGSGGFGGGVHTTSGTALRITGSSVTGNVAADGAPGGSGGAEGGGGGDGGSGGTGGGVDVGGREGQSLAPVITGTKIAGNRAGRGGDAGAAGPGGYEGYAGFGGGGGGLAVYAEVVTVDGGWITDNSAGGPGAGAYPSPASGGGIDTLRARVALVGGAEVTGNRPDNCYSVVDVPGCVNDGLTARAPRAGDRDLRVEDRALSIMG